MPESWSIIRAVQLGQDAHDAVVNAVVLEVAKMAYNTFVINPGVGPIDGYLLDAFPQEARAQCLLRAEEAFGLKLQPSVPAAFCRQKASFWNGNKKVYKRKGTVWMTAVLFL